MLDISKPFYLSKTFWINLLVPVLVFLFPAFKEMIVANLAESSAVWGIINILLRLVTKQPIEISSK
jgi:uncharacterized membrane protein